MMDMYFESSYDNMLSLDEMLDTDLKYSLELGLEVKDGTGIGAGPGLASEDWGSWGLHQDGGASSFDFDSSNGNVMVNPKSVIPSRRHSPVPETQTEIVKFKTDQDSDKEDDEPARKIIKQEAHEVEEEEEEESDDGSEEDEEEPPARPQHLQEVALKKKMALTSVKLSQASGKPRTMWLLSKSQVDSKGPQIVNAGSLIKMKPFADFAKAPSPTVTSNGVQIIKPNPNKLKTNGSKSPPSPIITSNGVQILKPNPNLTAKAKMQAQLLISSNHARTNGLKPPALTSQYPKPAYSYSCLIAMALKNSLSGSLPVSEIYGFMCEHFPYFRSAPTGWKNSVRHNLSLNKCFEKIEKVTNGGPGGGGVRKGCLWAMNPTKISKMDDEVAKWSRKDPLAIRRAMRHPDDLEKLEKGEMKFGSISNAIEEDSGDDEVPEEEESEENCEAEKRINMFELAHILRDEDSTRAFLYDYKLLPQSKICPRCNVEMKLSFASNFYGWFKCLNNHRANAIKGTWFEGTPLGCREILLATYCFLRRFTLEQTLAEVSSGKDAVDQEVIVSWWYNTREVCIDAIEREYDELTSLGPIGGVGCTVIVDKMKIGELNNSHRRIKDNVFILVMLETGTGDYRIEVLERLDYNTMMNHIVQNVEPGTELLTEDWKGWSRLAHFGFSHKVLTNMEAIPSDTLWFPFRHKLRQNGISFNLLGHYLYEYLWRREITRRDIDPFIALLQDVAKMHEL